MTWYYYLQFSSSLTTLQLMVDRCKGSCEALSLSLTVHRSAVMRIGRSFRHECCKIKLGLDDLGVHVCSALLVNLS